MNCEDWPLCDPRPEAVGDTVEMAVVLAAYVGKYGPRGFNEARHVAVGVGRDAGWLTLPSTEAER
jgi:hypothetical protein